jgi:uncharacterized protein (TIGR00369 family)
MRQLPSLCRAGYDVFMTEKIANDDHCFCCGKQNSRGLQLEFRYPQKGRAETECKIPAYFTGWRNITHGGFLAMLLDETMAHSCISEGLTGVTVDIQVRYLKPAEVGEWISVSGQVAEVKSRIIVTEASVRNQAGDTVAKSSARFLKM